MVSITRLAVLLSAALPLLFLPTSAHAQSSQPGRVELREGDRICLIGNAFAERMQHHGWFEARLQAAFPEMGLTVRNLGFSGDELTVRQRTAGFGTQDEWLTRCEADVILACFGFNEAFTHEELSIKMRGSHQEPRSAARFRRELVELVEHLRGQRYNGESAPRIVLVAPIAQESHDGGPPVSLEHRQFALREAGSFMREVAAELGVGFIDLFGPSRGLYRAQPDPLTINGIHLTDRGCERMAGAIEACLVENRLLDAD